MLLGATWEGPAGGPQDPQPLQEPQWVERRSEAQTTWCCRFSLLVPCAHLRKGGPVASLSGGHTSFLPALRVQVPWLPLTQGA